MQQLFNFDISTIICETQTLISKIRNHCQRIEVPNNKRKHAQTQVQHCLNLLGEENESPTFRNAPPNN